MVDNDYSMRPLDLNRAAFEKDIIKKIINRIGGTSNPDIRSVTRPLRQKFDAIFKQEINPSDLILGSNMRNKKTQEAVTYLGYCYIIQEIYSNNKSYLDDYKHVYKDTKDDDSKEDNSKENDSKENDSKEDDSKEDSYLFSYETQFLLGLLLLAEQKNKYLKSNGQSFRVTNKKHVQYDEFLIGAIQKLQKMNSSLPVGEKHIGIPPIMNSPSFQSAHSIINMRKLNNDLQSIFEHFYPPNKQFNKSKTLEAIHSNLNTTLFNLFCSSLSSDKIKSIVTSDALSSEKIKSNEKSDTFPIYKSLDKCLDDEFLTVEQLMINSISNNISGKSVCFKLLNEEHKKDFDTFFKTSRLPKDVIQKYKYQFFKELSITTSIEEFYKNVSIHTDVIKKTAFSIASSLNQEAPSNEYYNSVDSKNNWVSRIFDDTDYLKKLIIENQTLYINNVPYLDRFNSPKTSEKSINLIKEILFHIENFCEAPLKDVHNPYNYEDTTVYSFTSFLKEVSKYRKSEKNEIKNEIALKHNEMMIQLKKDEIKKAEKLLLDYKKELDLLQSLEKNHLTDKFEKDSRYIDDKQLSDYIKNI